jgi:ammonia channel protein AmtB
MAPGIAAVVGGLSLSMFPVARRGTVYIGIALAGAGAGLAAITASAGILLVLLITRASRPAVPQETSRGAVR